MEYSNLQYGAPIPIDPNTGRPVRGKGSRGTRGSNRGSSRGSTERKSVGGGMGRGFVLIRGVREGGRVRGAVRGGRGSRGPRGGAHANVGEGRGQVLPPTALAPPPPDLFAPPLAPVLEKEPEKNEEDGDEGLDSVMKNDQNNMLSKEDQDKKQTDEDKKEDDDEDDGGGGEMVDNITIHPKTDEERAALKALIDNMSEENLHRFEVFRRSRLSKPLVKKVLSTLFNQAAIHPSVCIAVAGCGKLFIGEMVEQALEVKEEWGDTGALSPDHIREAWRRRQKRSLVPL